MKINLRSIGVVDFPDDHQIRFQKATAGYPEGAAMIMNGGKLGALFRLNDIIEITEAKA